MKIKCSKCGVMVLVSNSRYIPLLKKFGSKEEILHKYLCKRCRNWNITKPNGFSKQEHTKGINDKVKEYRSMNIQQPVLSMNSKPILTSIWLPTTELLNEYKTIPFYKEIVYTGRSYPYVARNLILLYSKEGDVVCDLMVGSGTTIYEAYKLSRKVVCNDINKDAIISLKKRWEKYVGSNLEIYNNDATHVPEIKDNSVDLIIISFPWRKMTQFNLEEESMENKKTYEDYLLKCEDVYRECYRILKVNGYVVNILGGQYYKGKTYSIINDNMNILKKLNFEYVYQFYNLMTTPNTIQFPYLRSAISMASKFADMGYGKDVHEDIIVFRKREVQ